MKIYNKRTKDYLDYKEMFEDFDRRWLQKDPDTKVICSVRQNDKNGQELLEGDLVQWIHTAEITAHKATVQMGIPLKGVIVWNVLDAGFNVLGRTKPAKFDDYVYTFHGKALDSKRGIEWYCRFFNWNELEKIGNVFENGKLARSIFNDDDGQVILKGLLE